MGRFKARDLRDGTSLEEIRRTLNEIQKELAVDLGTALSRARVTELIIDGPYAARYGDVVRVAPPSGGLRVILPPKNLEQPGARVVVVVEGVTGALSVEAVDATVNGADTVTYLAGLGTVEFQLTPTGWYGWSVALVDMTALAGAGLSFTAGAFAVNGSTSITIASDQVQRAALTGAVVATLNSNATVFGTGAAGSSLSGDGTASLKLIGATSTVNSASTAGDLNVFDISALECGGVVTLQTLTEANIDGFTAKADGFWFVLHVRDSTTTDYVTLTENNGNTTTSLRCPGVRDYRLTKNESVMLIYSNSRWRVVAHIPKLWLTSSDAVTWAAQQDNFSRTSRGVATIRVTLTGNQILTGVVPGTDGAPGGEILLIENVDTVDTLTINHDATSTAANRFFCPASANYAQGPLTSSLWRYDSTSSRWRMMAHS